MQAVIVEVLIQVRKSKPGLLSNGPPNGARKITKKNFKKF